MSKYSQEEKEVANTVYFNAMYAKVYLEYLKKLQPYIQQETHLFNDTLWILFLSLHQSFYVNLGKVLDKDKRSHQLYKLIQYIEGNNNDGQYHQWLIERAETIHGIRMLRDKFFVHSEDISFDKLSESANIKDISIFIEEIIDVCRIIDDTLPTIMFTKHADKFQAIMEMADLYLKKAKSE